MTVQLTRTCLGRLSTVLGLTGLGLATSLTADSSIGFIRTVEGAADLLHGSSQPAIEATANYPLQVGDRLRVSSGGRMDVVLPDRSLLRLDANSELRLGRLAESIDSHDNQNLLELFQGQMQAVLPVDPADPRAFRIDTANTSIFLASAGSFRIFTDGKSWTQVIVRDGYAEVTTERSTDRVGPGQQAISDGERSPRVTLQAAPPLDDLELWAQRLDAREQAVEAQIPYRRGYVSPTLSYAAAPLYRHGRWLSYEGCNVWRPHVPYGWRPYHAGWWIYTPVGLTWVSTEPWGWVPYHYGHWSHAGGIGWVWYPGHRYTPGAVHWYWGPTHVGWFPAPHFTPYHDVPLHALPPHGSPGGYGSGTSSSPTDWRHWTFSPYDKFGFRDSHRFVKTGAELERKGVFRSRPEGILTTETRRLTPNLWDKPERVMAALRQPPSTRPRTRALSPLAAAALGEGPSFSPPEASQRLGSSPSRRLVRQWDPDSWRRSSIPRTQIKAPYRRDTRSSGSRLRSQEGSSLQTQPRSRLLDRRPSSRTRSSTGLSRPAPPGAGRSTVGQPPRSPGPNRSGVHGGGLRAPSRAPGTAPGRSRGSGRSGGAMKPPPKGTTSGSGGSG